jgi:aryl-alcohol dehydrogenase-like predicted oxidoreductase
VSGGRFLPVIGEMFENTAREDVDMRYRRFGSLDCQVSEVGYGMWGIAGGEGGWTGADDESGMQALQLAVDLGCTFFDTAWIYGRGHSEEMLGDLRRANPDRELIIATKIPPKDRAFPSTRESRLDDVFPADHIREYAEKSLANLGVDSVDLLQFHVWEDSWATDDRWQEAVGELKRQGLVRGVGISVNRWEPTNVLRTLETGLIDTVQVIYNVFDQSPEDELFPVCRERGIGVIARVPFDEGTLTGTLTKDSTWPEGDWRNGYFVPENLHPAVERADELKKLVPEGMTLPEMVLRFILADPTVSTVIPGMRKEKHVRANLAAGDGSALPADLLAELRAHRWDREPTWWSQ